MEKATNKTIKFDLVAFCDHASMSVDGKLNLNGIFDVILAKKFPTTHPQVYVVTKFHMNKGEHSITFALMQKDEVLAKTSTQKNIEAEGAVHTHIWSVNNLPIRSAEPIELQILHEGGQVLVKRLLIGEAKNTSSN